jgi:lipopolysaccharide/colanic/teichoic acid biosynthesis glycosyltransferase
MKFRSMFDGAERAGNAVWAEERDPRITPIGRFMRKFRLDELPQVFNVLRGDMSFVGPRPERPEFIAVLSREIPYYSLRLAVKPGITGWAQIKYRYGASIQDAAEKLQYDLYYIKHMSLALDAGIAMRTVRTVLSQFGAR